MFSELVVFSELMLSFLTEISVVPSGGERSGLHGDRSTSESIVSRREPSTEAEVQTHELNRTFCFQGLDGDDGKDGSPGKPGLPGADVGQTEG